MVIFFFFFFFSSRRRHTRCSRDWSSDVCSSDLGRVALSDYLCGAERERSAHSQNIESPHSIDESLAMRRLDRKSTRLNSSHGYISYAVFCLKKKKKNKTILT